MAQSRELRAAIAWSSVPTIWAILLWIPSFIFVGPKVFTSESMQVDNNPGQAMAMIGTTVGGIVIGIRRAVVYLKCVGEVHEFSAWRALGASLLTVLIVTGVVTGGFYRSHARRIAQATF